MNLRNLVYQCLDQQDHTRDDDMALYIAVIERGENCLLGDSISIELLKKYHLPTVIRHRADLQNKQKLCMATDKVRVKRMRYAETKRKLFGIFPIFN